MVTETFIKAVERFLMPCETDSLCITQPALKHSKLEYIPQTVLFTDPVVSLGCKTILKTASSQPEPGCILQTQAESGPLPDTLLHLFSSLSLAPFSLH